MTDGLLQRKTIAVLVRQAADRIERGEISGACIAIALVDGKVECQLGGSDEGIVRCLAALMENAADMRVKTAWDSD